MNTSASDCALCLRGKAKLLARVGECFFFFFPVKKEASFSIREPVY